MNISSWKVVRMTRVLIIALSAILYISKPVATQDSGELNQSLSCDDYDGDNYNEGNTNNATPEPTTELSCGDNQVVDSCPVDCPADSCPKSRYDDQSKCPKPEKCPPPACKCGFNSRKSVNGTCIPTRDCPPFECTGPNEEYNPCPSYCPGENCTQATPDGKCRLGKIGVVVECKPDCRCKKSYWRQDGICVPYEQCRKQDATIDESEPTTTESTNKRTTEHQEVATPKSTNVTCGNNEILDNCPVDCPADSCPKSRYDDQSPCPKPAPENCPPPACKCGFNSRRSINGTCISTRNCPPFRCTGPNEEYNPCPSYCPGENCSQATPDGKCHLPGRLLFVVQCKPTCRCKKGYWRLNGLCVPYKLCPKKNITIVTKPKITHPIISTRGESPEQQTQEIATTESTKLTCASNEVVDNCPVDCSRDNCPKSRYDDQSRCPKPAPENCPPPACKCGFNSRRSVNGTCIPTRDCPPFECTEPNEEYNPCPSYCPGEDCSQATPDGECHLVGRIGIVVECVPACRCKKNYWKLNGTCVPYDECPKQGSEISGICDK